MAQVTKPIALDESLNTTEATPRNIADVLAEEIGNLVTAVSRIAPSTTVSWSQIQQSGTKIAEITINGSTTDVYAPTGGGFSALLIITAGTGLTVTASKGGDSYTATETSTGTYEVSVDSAGTWTVSDGSNTATVAVSASTTYYVTLSSVPDGSTVTPTDDVQILLACAGITDKSYTTLTELFADTTTLASVIADNNAIDYLVRSKTFSGIGLVPKMTGYTTPSGEVIAQNSSQISSNAPAWYAFDGDSSTHAEWTVSSTSEWIGYDFGSPKKISRFGVISRAGDGSYTFTIGYSDDGTNWTDYDTPLIPSVASPNWSYQNVSIDTFHRYWRVKRNSTSGIYGFGANEIQFFSQVEGFCDNQSAMSYIGLNNYASNTLIADDTWCRAILLSDYVESVMNVKMPPVNMTGASTPAGNGTVYGSSVGTSSGSPYYYPWKAFDGVISSDSGWENSPSDTIPVYLGYKLPSAKCLKGMTFINVRNYGAKDFTVQGSNDSSESTGFTDIKSFVIAETTSKQAFPFGTNTTDYSNIRLYFTSLYNSPTNKYAHVTEIKFYGRADV